MLPQLDLPEFNPDSIANAIRTQISSDIWINYSGSEILEALREQGLGIRSSVFYQIRREVLGLFPYQKLLSNLSEDDIVPASYFFEGHGLQLSNNFIYRFLTTIVNQNTGEEITGIRSISSNRQIYISDLIDVLRSNIETGNEKSDWILDEATLTAALARPGVFREIE